MTRLQRTLSRLFLSGAALFGLASLGAGLAGTGAELITARIFQGVAAAAMAPQVLATFRVMFSGKERGKAFGIYGAMLGFASSFEVGVRCFVVALIRSPVPQLPTRK